MDKMATNQAKIIMYSALVLLSASSMVIGILIGYFMLSDDGSALEDSQFDTASFIVKNVDKERIRETLMRYSREPRLSGTKMNKDLAEIIADDWRKSGLEDVHINTYNILLSFPMSSKPNLIEIFEEGTTKLLFRAKTREVPLTPQEKHPNVGSAYNSYAPAQIVIAKLVYVNYGTIEDFEHLTLKMNISVKGALVIARYGKIFTGDKLKIAQTFKAAGLILYSDPGDFNMGNTSNMYPESRWLPASGIQRGTVGDNGDPQTPIYPSTHYAHRLNMGDALSIKIPCQPIGYGDAEQILKNLGGMEAPENWKGKLKIKYTVGPGYAEKSGRIIRLTVNNILTVRPVYNVIGYVKGSIEPDRYVLLGNHHDAWVFGAVDPQSGSAAVTEIARIFGEMLKQGQRPRRTLVFCSWDAEEFGQMGSTEWVEDNLKLLHQRGVAYINLALAAEGNFTIAVGTSPLLQDLMYDAAKEIPSPEPPAATLYDLWKLRPLRGSFVAPEPYIYYSLGSSSDMAAFYQRAGVASVDMKVTYDQKTINISSCPVCHSAYDTFIAYDSSTDPGFHYTKAVTQFAAVVVSNLANAKLLPMNVERYSAAVEAFYETLTETFGETWKKQNINIENFKSAVRNFTLATKRFQEKLHSDRTIHKNPIKLRMINDKIMMLERAFLDPEGLPGRPMQKHVMFAPSMFDAYTDNRFPGITDTMFQISRSNGSWEVLRKQIFIATYIVQSASKTFEDFEL